VRDVKPRLKFLEKFVPQIVVKLYPFEAEEERERRESGGE
jgi:hypothetical protein